MDDLFKEQQRLEKVGNYHEAIDETQKLIDDLIRTREAVAAQPTTAVLQLAKVKGRVLEAFREANSNLKQVNGSLKGYEKALGKIFKTPFEDSSSIQPKPYLINRAVIMHLLREGEFGVAATFWDESKDINKHSSPDTGSQSPNARADTAKWEKESEVLHEKFQIMYGILEQMRHHHNLDPAIEWAKENTEMLEARGSNLEFELCRLRFVSLFLGDGTNDTDTAMDLTDSQQAHDRITRAAAYAQVALEPFQRRYASETYKLIGAMAFWQNIPDSPYSGIINLETAWDDLCSSFTKEFCSLMGLSPHSPLYIACAAGSIALPKLSKYKAISKIKRTEWTTKEEMPVEIPLPPEFRFHHIFVCPVSKEQATKSNPPMMLPCGHVLCRDSLRNVSKASRFKCPYCPVESHWKDAKEVFL